MRTPNVTATSGHRESSQPHRNTHLLAQAAPMGIESAARTLYPSVLVRLLIRASLSLSLIHI